ncbi:adenylate/guanylate cyclase domain-containing protein [Inquilinus sp. CA228]|uniref:adenylate/guanylate cyclase domain-containing protein n=1 Tax=Inquilinus sp. CA228 TaxID=3455609 RepID=UPI003F8D4C1E
MSKGQGRGWAIAALLPLLLGGLIAAAILPVILVGFFGSQDVSRRLLRDRTDLLIEAVVTPIEHLLTPVSQETDRAAGLVAEGRIDPADIDAFGAFTAGLAASTPQVSTIAVITPDGGQRLWPGGELAPPVDTNVLAIRKRLLDQAERGAAGRWSAPFVRHSDGAIVLSYRAPIRRDGRLLGLLAADVSVGSLSSSLDGIGREFEVVPFILADRTRVVAHPAMAAPERLRSIAEAGDVPTIDTIDDASMAAIWSSPNALTSIDPPRRGTAHWGPVGDAYYTYIYRDLPIPADLPLIAGFYRNSATTGRDRWSGTVVLGVSIVLLMLAVLAAAVLGRRLARPLTAFGEASTAIAQFDFREPGLERWERSPVSEVASTAAAIRRTATAVRSFERYAPKALVRELLSLGPESSLPDKREMTILFLDLEGYTRFADGRSATEVADYLNTIFGRIGPIVEEAGGTIDKYTGDGLMAFWGAPLRDDDHARHAVAGARRIAVELAGFIDGERSAGRAACRVRIGLHTGEVVVGDLGYPGRMNYTVVGETANTAKRTEAALRGVRPEAPVVLGVTRSTIERSGLEQSGRPLTPLEGGRVWLVGLD